MTEPKELTGIFIYDKDTRGGKHRYSIEGTGLSGSLYLSKIYTGSIPNKIILKKYDVGGGDDER